MVKKMKTAVYPGSFDPVTNGHLDIIRRASTIFDKLQIVVFNNSLKNCAFSVEERMQMLRDATADIKNVEIGASSELLVHYLQKNNIKTIIKGLRMISDFEYEFQMALANREQNPDIETLFLMTASEYSHLSSSLVRELASYGGDLTKLVPHCIMQKVYDKFSK